jgi:predicted aspartyl protease
MPRFPNTLATMIVGMSFAPSWPGSVTTSFFIASATAQHAEPATASPSSAVASAPRETADKDEEPHREPVWATPTTFDRIGRIVAPVYVNGRGPYRFIIDTGASRSAIAPRVARELELELDPHNPVALRGVTGTEEVPSIVVEELRAGELVLEQQRLPVVRPSVFANADGILGMDGFDGMCLRVKFWENEVSIVDNGCPRSRLDWPRVRARIRFGHLLTVRARIGGTKVTAIVDTGAERSLGNLALLRALELEEHSDDPSSQASVTGATEHTVPGSLVRSPRISVGEVTITNLSVTFGDFEVFRFWDLSDKPSMLLGMDVLGTVDGMMIDYKRGELRFIPAGAGTGTSFRLNPRGTRLP